MLTLMFRTNFDNKCDITLIRQCGRCRQEHKIDIPVLVLWADGDSALGVNLLKGIHDEVPKVEVHVLENCSHWVQQDKCALMPSVKKLHSLLWWGHFFINSLFKAE